ncbi:MAG: endonuclease/exonuclease/phosphatase family protein [Candidatus Eremiobacteraeota bacterium]|nr:endonuclease/exonuclease/phosphatase family protein [Candidatus Eremiobacteraeota bacterium]
MDQLSPVRPRAARPPLRPQVESSSMSSSSGNNWKLAGAAALGAVGLLATPAAAQSAQVKVMSLNVWLDCKDGVDGIAEVIRAGNPDVVGLQEIGSCAEPLSQKLGYQLVRQNEWKSMLTRLPVESVTPARHGMVVRLSDGRPLAVFNAHLYHSPYQPYQLLGIPYGDGVFIKTEAEAQEQSRLARGADVQSVLEDMATVDAPKVLTGDFNEPSHLDWTQRAAESGRHPIKVEWPASKAFEQAGLKDAYRVVYPDEMAHPGNTWTPRTAADDPKDHHDRLDFIMVDGLQVRDVKVVGPDADIVVTPYPTDHRGVVAELTVSP